jgi:helicase
MKVEKLLRYGIPHTVIESWRKSQGENLLPLQAIAVTKHDLLNGASLIISAPTSSGKTFCGEMAAAASLFKRKKVVFLVPLKAIAEEKYSDFCHKYSELGIKVVISTRDRQEHDRSIERGNFDLAIMIYEKFNQLLIKNMDVLKLISLLVVDELQMIADPSRGPVLELALTKIRSSKYSPQILGLSAVLRDVDQLSSWLGCRLLFDKSRPVELLQGVLLDGKFHFRKYNSGEEGTDELVALESELSHEILFANLEKLLEKGEQVLIFLKSRADCEKGVFLFSERVNLPSSAGAIEALSELENTTLKERLDLCLQKGIAFHNADLTSGERRVVERFYLQGEIRVIFSTTTLALGINLPAKTVFIETQKFEKGEYSGKPVMLPITWSEYENMSGRAGRFGLQKDFGRSIIIAQNDFQFDALWEGYVEGEEEKLNSQLLKKELGDVVLDLVASGVGKTPSQLKDVLRSSFDTESILQVEGQIEDKLKELLAENVLIENRRSLSPSRLGRLCAFKGISTETGLCIKKKLEAVPDLDSFSWFSSVLNTKDGEEVYINLGYWEEQNRVYERALQGRYRDTSPADEQIRLFLEKNAGFSSRENRLVKICLLLCEWMTPVSTLDLEQKYSCRSGQIEQIAKRASWLLDAACGMARILNSDRKLVHFLRRLSLQVDSGVDDAGIKLARLRVSGLGRDYVWRLVREGFASPSKIKEAKLEELQRVIPETVARRLKETLEQRPKGSRKGKTLSSKMRSAETNEMSLVIDGSPVKDKFLILVNGRKTILPAKSFKYLVKLVWAAFKTEDGWIHKNDLEPGDNQTRYVYRLRKQIKPSLDPGQFMIENNRLGSYRLSVPKHNITVNPSTLGKNPDAEIKDMARQLLELMNKPEKLMSKSTRQAKMLS